MGESSDDSSLIDRLKSWARAHAFDQNASRVAQRSVLPTINPQQTNVPCAVTTSPHDTKFNNPSGSGPNRDNAIDSISSITPPPAPPESQIDGASSPPVEHEKQEEAPTYRTRLSAGSTRFWRHTVNALCYSWVNVLLIFVPIGIAAEVAHLNPTIIFAVNAVAIVPLAGLLSHATENVASRLGDTLGALLNVSFGNAVELIIFIIALVKDEIRIVQASLLGSILANLLLILGMAFLLGGLRYREQVYNSTVTQMSACLLSLSVMSLLLPTAFHASFAEEDEANRDTLKISRGTSVVLLLIYVLYLLFQLKSHAYMYESTPQQIIDEESHPGVLHDMPWNSSSSSSSSSDSSSSDTDTTSGSHTTAKRIKQAFKNRKRRKSSISSKDASSLPSKVSSPSTDVQSGFMDSQALPGRSRQGSVSFTHAILSGDEADTDGESDPHTFRTHVQDFEKKTAEGSHSPKRKQRKKKKSKRKRHHKGSESNGLPDRDHQNVLVGTENQTPANTTSDSTAEPRVGFAEGVLIQESNGTSNPRRPFNLRQFSTRPSTFRPPIPKMLTQTVFSTPPPRAGDSPAPGQPITPRIGPMGLRRANSLPDRLNRTGNPATLPPGNNGISQTQPLPQGEHGAAIEDDEHASVMSRTAAVVLLLVSTGLVAVCAEFLVSAIPEMVANSKVSQAFIGLIILPIVGNAAEHVTAVTVAAKNKMDLAIGVAVGSSIQIAIFVTPLVVVLGWCMDKPMSLYFNLFETVSLFVTAFVVNFLVLDGRSNYLEGALLIAAYVIIGVAAFFYPDNNAQSDIGGSNLPGS